MFSQASVRSHLWGYSHLANWGYPLPGSGCGGGQEVPHPRSGQGDTPSQVRTGDTPFPGQNGLYPLPRSGWGVPHQQDGVIPPSRSGWVPSSQVRIGGYPIPGQDGDVPGYPPISRMGFPLPVSRKGYPPSRSQVRTGSVLQLE